MGKLSILITFFVVQVAASLAFADCSSPVATAGNIQWIAASNEVQYCDGTYWKSASVATQAGTCFAADAGKILYQSSDLQFCNGANWVSMNGVSLGTSCSAAGIFTYDSAASLTKWCDGTNWKRVGADQVAIAYAGSVNSVADQTTYNFGSVPIGVASATRYVLVGISARSASNFVPTSVTIGGVSATQVVSPYQVGGTTAGFFIAAVPTGTTAAVNVTFSGQMVRAIVESWSVTNLQSTTAITSYNFEPLTGATIAIPAGGAAFGVAGSTQSGAVGVIQWNAGGLTNNHSVRVTDDFDYTAAGGSLAAPTAVAGKSATASVTNGGNSANRAAQIVILR